jgi:hypothetical protein
LTPESVEPYSFFPDSIIPFRGQKFFLEDLIDEPELDYFELGKFIANLPFLADCGFDDSEGITKFLKSVNWGKDLEVHLNQIKNLDYLDSVASSLDARVAKEILSALKNAQNSTETKHEFLMNLAMLEIAYKDYFEGYKAFLRGLKSDFDESQVLVSEGSGPLYPDWSDLEQSLWDRSELFWASCMAAVQQSLSNAKKIGWWFDPNRTVLLSLGSSWFVIHDKDEESFRLVPPTSDLLKHIGFHSGKDCLWFQDLEQCEIEHNHDEARVLFLDVAAPMNR